VLDPTDYWDHRLENWAMWLVGGATGGATVSAMWTMIGRGGGRGEARDVVLAGDAIDTDALVKQLEATLRDAVHVEYTQPGTKREKAALLHCHPDTLKARVAAAKVRLDELDHGRRVAAKRAQEAARRTLGA
jgi:hypothetical protein